MSENDRQFKKFLAISFSLHAFIVIFTTVKTVFFRPPKPLILEDSIRVDIVALPEKIKQAPKKSKKIVKKPPVKKEPQVDMEAAKNAQQLALDQLNALSALDSLEDEKPDKKEKKPVKKESVVEKEVEYKGNIISAGTSLKGVQRLQHEKYTGHLKNHIKKFWYLPEWLSDKDFKARVLLKINKQGNILEYQLEAASENEEFNEIVLNTVKKAEPYPAPPEKFIEILSVDGLLLGFPN